MRKFLLAGSLVAILIVGFIISGCLINPPDTPNKVANILKLNPTHLERLPAEMIYQGWLVKGDTIPDVGWTARDRSEWKSFGRFNWDQYDHVPIDASGTPIDNYFDAKTDVFAYDRIYITIEEAGASDPALPSEVVILAGDVDLLNEDADLEHPISTSEVSDFTVEQHFWIYTQSDTAWYDTLTLTKGIWFGQISKADRVVFDTLCFMAANETDPMDISLWDWGLCPRDPITDERLEEPDTVHFCSFLDSTSIDTSYEIGSIDDTVDPPETTFTIGYIDTTEYWRQDECYPGIDEYNWEQVLLDYDSVIVLDTISFHDTVFVIPDGDTALAPSLETMPDAKPGWEYEAWVIFDEGSGYEPLSMGRFTRPRDSSDDRRAYYDSSTSERYFTVPGEDFFKNVPNFGSLDVINNPYTDKIYITVEPEPDFDPDHPFLQLIMFSGPIPPPGKFFEPASTSDPDVLSQRANHLDWPLVLRDIGYDLNDGHFWPTMHIELEREMVVPK